jgi:sugar-specific transcriptional regulator TrmB
MTQEEEPIETFMNLGLTQLQAKVYLTLLKLDDSGADVKKISLASRIARQDIYRRLPELEKIGLVEKIIGLPTVYKAVPFEEGLSMLMKKNTIKYYDIQKKAKTVLSNFSISHHSQKQAELESQFIITSEQTLFLKRVRHDIEETEKVISIIYAHERLSTILFHVVEEIEAAIERGVKIRAITDNAHGGELDRNLKALTKKPAFNLRLINHDTPVGLVIFDNKDVNIRTSNNIVPSLWTNNRNVVKLAKVYFDDIWRNGQSSLMEPLLEEP